jgi:hypothetical protein
MLKRSYHQIHEALMDIRIDIISRVWLLPLCHCALLNALSFRTSNWRRVALVAREQNINDLCRFNFWHLRTFFETTPGCPGTWSNVQASRWCLSILFIVYAFLRFLIGGILRLPGLAS